MRSEIEHHTSDGMDTMMITVIADDGRKSQININMFSDGTIAVSRLLGRETLIGHEKENINRKHTIDALVYSILNDIENDEHFEYLRTEFPMDFKASLRRITKNAERKLEEYRSQVFSFHVNALRYVKKSEEVVE